MPTETIELIAYAVVGLDHRQAEQASRVYRGGRAVPSSQQLGIAQGGGVVLYAVEEGAGAGCTAGSRLGRWSDGVAVAYVQAVFDPGRETCLPEVAPVPE